MKRPLAAVTLVYIAGLIVGDCFPLAPDILLPISLGLVLLTLFALARQGSIKAHALLWPLVLMTGWTNLSCQTTALSPRDFRNLGLDAAELVTVRGRLVDTPSQRIFVRDDKESYRFLSNLRAQEIRRNKRGWEPVAGTLLVLTPGSLPGNYFGGQEAEITGVLSKPDRAVASGLFDYADYLRRQSIYFQLKTEGTSDWALLAPLRMPSLSDRFLNWAQAAISRGLPVEDEPLKMLWAMTLGWKTVDNRIYEPFMKSGTMHIFAISGLHIALIAGIFVALLRVLQVPRNWCGALVIPAIWFYTAATGWQPSAIRSTIMMSIIIGGWALARPTDLLNSLAASALCILVWDPQQIFGASFQLSFFVVLSIGLLLPGFERVRDQWIRMEPLLPSELVPVWKRRVFAGLRWVTSSVAISLSAWVGALPLTAYYFHLFSPVTLLANVVVVPLSSCALAANLGSLLCAGWCGSAAELFNHTAWFCMKSMVLVSQAAAEAPLGCRWVQAPSVGLMVVYYALATGVCSGYLLVPKRRILLLMAGLCAVILPAWLWVSERSRVSLTIVPLSGGYSVLAQHGRLGADLLVDCGRTNSVQFTMEPLLHARGINRLGALALTHGDIRHVGGAALLGEEFKPYRVFASAVKFRSTVYRQSLQWFEGRPRTDLHRVDPGAQIGPWRVLHPREDDRFGQADDGALVLEASFKSARVLLLSDLGNAGQTTLLERYPDLRADIVVTGLPARGEAAGEEFIKRVRPGLIIVADSQFPAAERASRDFCARLKASRIPVVYTRACGTVTVEVTDRGWLWRSRSRVE